MTLTDLVDRARRLLDRPDRVALGITGPPGAGKSTLTAALLAELGPEVGHLPMDGFHLADAQLDRLGLRDRKGQDLAGDSINTDQRSSVGAKPMARDPSRPSQFRHGCPEHGRPTVQHNAGYC